MFTLFCTYQNSVLRDTAVEQIKRHHVSGNGPCITVNANLLGARDQSRVHTTYPCCEHSGHMLIVLVFSFFHSA